MTTTLVLALVATALWAYALGTVMVKAGYRRWWWVGVVPVFGAVAVVVLAFVDWPVERENRVLRDRAGVA